MKNRKRNVPILAERLLSLFASRLESDSLADDLQEEYGAKLSERGSLRAALWYWLEIVKAAPHFICHSVYWSFVMIKNYLLIALRTVKRQSGYSFITITGLAVGLATVILLLLYVQFEMSFDTFNEQADRIYRVAIQRTERTDTSSLMPGPLAPAMREEFPEVESAARIYDMNNVHISCGGKNIFEDNFFFVDQELFDIFTFELRSGDAATALSDPHSIIISESIAEKYFGDKDPIGEIVTFRESIDFSVTGVLKNIPENSHLTMHFIVPIKTIEQVYSIFDLENWLGFSYNTYFKLRKGAEPSTLLPKLHILFNKYLAEKSSIDYTAFFQPLKKIHLYSDTTGEIAKTGDIKIIYLIIAIAIILLVTACVNYINLATARAGQRAREIGVRKTIGALRIQLFRQFLGESMMLTLVSFLLAMVIAILFLPTFNSFVERNLSLNLFRNPQFFLWLLALVLCVGFLSGSYPAIALSRFNPAVILSSRTATTKRASLRNILVVVQFTISIALIISTLLIKGQLNYIHRKDVGFSRDNILIVDIRNSDILNNIEAVKNELTKNPQILAVATSTFTPNATGMATRTDWPGKPEEIEQNIHLNFIDYDFIDLYDIRIVRGRNVSRDFRSDSEGAFLLNETAVSALGWNEPLGKNLTHFIGRRTGKIVGVVKDFHMNPLYEKIAPLCLDCSPDNAQNYLSLKLANSSSQEIIEYIKTTLALFAPNYPFEWAYFDDIFNRAYRTEQKIQSIFGVFSLLAIFISCLGLFGLASFAVQQRTKEIGIRKVLGAPASTILLLLLRNFIQWLLIANIFAWPLTYIAAGRFLKLYAYRITPGLHTFTLAGLGVVFVALLTVSYQALKAVATNPVNALKYE